MAKVVSQEIRKMMTEAGLDEPTQTDIIARWPAHLANTGILKISRSNWKPMHHTEILSVHLKDKPAIFWCEDGTLVCVSNPFWSVL